MRIPTALFKTVRRRDPFSVRQLPFLARLFRTAFRTRRRLSKRFVGKPAKRLFNVLYHTLGMGGTGTFALEIGGTPRPFPFNARNTQFSALFLPQHDAGYESETAALLDVLCPDGGTFVDVGANWGFYSLFLASRPGFAGRIHAIEPWPPTFADLSTCVAETGLAGTVTCHNVALSAEEGRAAMGLPDGLQSGLARLSVGTRGDPEVDLKPLDALDVGAPDVIKIDVEGHEAAAIAGARSVLERHRPHVIFESWIEKHDPEITFAPFRALAEMGYVFFQPAWSEPDAGGRHAVDGVPGGEAVIALVPITAEQRFLLADQINAVAVHAERLDDLAALFQD